MKIVFFDNNIDILLSSFGLFIRIISKCVFKNKGKDNSDFQTLIVIMKLDVNEDDNEDNSNRSSSALPLNILHQIAQGQLLMVEC